MRKVDSLDLKSNSLTLNFTPSEGKLFVIKVDIETEKKGNDCYADKWIDD